MNLERGLRRVVLVLSLAAAAASLGWGVVALTEVAKYERQKRMYQEVQKDYNTHLRERLAYVQRYGRPPRQSVQEIMIQDLEEALASDPEPSPPKTSWMSWELDPAPWRIVGLTVKAVLDTRDYDTGHTISPQQIEALNLRRHSFHPDWNYTVAPQSR